MTVRFVVVTTVALSMGTACTQTWSGASGGYPAPQASGRREASADRVPLARSPGMSLSVRATKTGRTIAFDEMVDAAAQSDVVFFGEEHTDPETHFAEFALLEGIGQRRANVVLSLEMFERDVQPLIDDYLAGRISEAAFLAKSRPWDRYATDYRALVVLARARGWPVIAANVPRPIASAVGRGGLAVLDTLTPASRAWVARRLVCPRDAYFDRFVEAMGGHSAGAAPGGTVASAGQSAATVADTSMTFRFYQAQCVKDETMAESIVEARRRAGAGAIVVHFNGSFHSDYGQGTAQRVARAIPEAPITVITAVPDSTPATTMLGVHRAKGDFVIFARR